MRVRSASGLLLSALACLSAPALAADRLPAMGADAKRVSVSGLSSGAFMAVQYDVAFSAQTMGAGIVAGGPYNCAWVNVGGITTCMQGSPNASASLAGARGFAALGSIDPVRNIGRHRIYLFSGTGDKVVHPSAMKAVERFYRLAGVPAGNMVSVFTMAAGHAFISDDIGGSCDANAAPFINKCPQGAQLYDQPMAILTRIYGPLQAKAASLSSAPLAFDQSEFPGAVGSGMAKEGYVYVPAACRDGQTPCAVHVVFHGCAQSVESVGSDVYEKLGYNEWADTNRIILLYPQVNKSMVPLNPMGCWDWWGYSGLNFQTKAGAQLSVINAMVRRLTSR